MGLFLLFFTCELFPKFNDYHSFIDNVNQINNVDSPQFNSYEYRSDEQSSMSPFSFTTIELRIAKFIKCSSFGRALNSAGGCIYGDCCNIYCFNSEFLSNEATSGGSITAINSRTLFQDSSFKEDHSFIFGGSLFLSSGYPMKSNNNFYYNDYFDSNYVKDSITHIYQTTFTQCKSEEFGAVFISFLSDVIIYGSSFKKCSAHYCGGALGLYCVNTLIRESSFIANFCGNPKNEIIPYKSSSKHQIRLPKGGGAILVIAETNDNQLELITTACIFNQNYVYSMVHLINGFYLLDTYPDRTTDNSGLDLLFSGNSFYRSYGDSFSWSLDFSIRNVTSFYYERTNFNVDFPETYGISLLSYSEPAKEPENIFQTYTDINFRTETTVQNYPTLKSKIPQPTTFSHWEKNMKLETELGNGFGRPIKPSPTASTGKGIPHSTLIPPSLSDIEETPLPTPSFSESFYGEPSQSQSASRTSSGRTWPTQTLTLSSPTASTGKGTAMATIITISPSQSYWGEIPPSTFKTVSFQGEPSQSNAPSRTKQGIPWPTQTSIIYPKIPTPSTEDETPLATEFSPSSSHWGEIPKHTPSPSPTFQQLFPTQSPTSTPSQSSVPEDDNKNKQQQIVETISAINSISIQKTIIESLSYQAKTIESASISISNSYTIVIFEGQESFSLVEFKIQTIIYDVVVMALPVFYVSEIYHRFIFYTKIKKVETVKELDTDRILILTAIFSFVAFFIASTILIFIRIIIKKRSELSVNSEDKELTEIVSDNYDSEKIDISPENEILQLCNSSALEFQSGKNINHNLIWI